MRQLVFEFVADAVSKSRLRLNPRTEEELIARMAEAILAVIEAALGSALRFTGVLAGVVTFIVVVVVMLVAEEAMVRFYRRLG